MMMQNPVFVHRLSVANPNVTRFSFWATPADAQEVVDALVALFPGSRASDLHQQTSSNKAAGLCEFPVIGADVVRLKAVLEASPEIFDWSRMLHNEGEISEADESIKEDE